MGFFAPRRYVADVTVLDLDLLWAQGKRALLLDRDNTIVARDTKAAPAEVVAWLEHARALGYKLCFVSNNWAKNVRPDAERFGTALVSRAAKPLPFGLWLALRRLGVSRDEALLVGDQVFTDVLGGRLAGIDTVLVEPLTEVDLAHTLFLRNFEAKVLAGMTPEPRPAASDTPGA